MAPAQAGGRMGGCETTPPDSRTDPGKPAPPVHGKPQPAGLSSLAIIGRRSPASSSFLLAAARLRGLQLDPRPRNGREPAATRKPSTTANPALTRPPGQDRTRSLTAKAPMGGWRICAHLPARWSTGSFMMCGRSAGAWAGHWVCQGITDCVWCCRAPEVAGPADRLGGARSKTAGERRQAPQQHLFGAGQRRTSRPPPAASAAVPARCGSPGRQPEPLVQTVMQPGQRLRPCQADDPGAQLVDTARAAAVYCAA